MSIQKLLRRFAKAVGDEAAQNPQFAKKLEDILEGASPRRKPRTPNSDTAGLQPKRGHRRAPAILDPVALASESEAVLRSQLSLLSLEQLKDVVAEYGMDPGKLVMKWKGQERVIEKIVELSIGRARKGDAFRSE